MTKLPFYLLILLVLSGSTSIIHSESHLSTGELIAFASDRNGSWDIYTVNPDGSNPQQITDEADVDFFDSSWSPDGSKLALASNQGLWVVNADGTDLQAYSPTGLINGVDWSPDGSKIAYGKSDIFTIGSDGSNWKNLTNDHGFHGYYNASPAWSPDGTKIVYHSRRDHPRGGDIYVMNADGTNKKLLAGAAGEVDDHPDWSPDGSTVIFDSERDDGLQIYAVNADGSNERRFTSPPFLNFAPVWSPDGTKIGTGCSEEGVEDICVFNVDGTPPINITHTAASENYPSWRGETVSPFNEKQFLPVVMID